MVAPNVKRRRLAAAKAAEESLRALAEEQIAAAEQARAKIEAEKAAAAAKAKEEARAAAAKAAKEAEEAAKKNAKKSPKAKKGEE